MNPNADTLDTIDSTQFQRTDASQNINAGVVQTHYNATGETLNGISGNRSLTLYQSTINTDAFITFHIGGDYAGYFGLGGAENDLIWGGWSVGNNRYRIWHSGNDGSGSGLDADLLDGWHANTAYNDFTGSRVPVRHSSGYLFSNYFNMSADVQTGNPQYLVGEWGSDNYLRYVTPSNVTVGNANACNGDSLCETTDIVWGTARTQTRIDAGAWGAGVYSGFYQNDGVTVTNYPAGASGWWHLLDVRHTNAANNYALQIAGSFFDQNLYFRKTNNSATTAWSKFAATNIQVYLQNSALNCPAAAYTGALTTSATCTTVACSAGQWKPCGATTCASSTGGIGCGGGATCLTSAQSCANTSQGYTSQ